MTQVPMRLFAYTQSPQIQAHLASCSSLRTTILTTALPPTAELRMRFDGDIDRIYWASMMEGISVTREHLTKLFLSDDGRKQTHDDESFLSLRRIVSFLAHQWLANPDPVLPRDIARIHTLLAHNTQPSPPLSKSLIPELQKALPYLDQTGGDHPILAAGLAFLTFQTDTRFSPWMARFVSYLYLFRGGWDVRGMIAPEYGLRTNLQSYTDAIEESKNRGNATPFLVLYTQAIRDNLTAIMTRIQEKTLANPIPHTVGTLTPRERDILLYLSHPDATITNKIVQKKYGVSQITASRDLSGLLSLGFVVARGKGRSVRYSRM